MSTPGWALGVNPDVKEVPGGLAPVAPPLSWDQLQATGKFLLDTFIGQVAIAFGGINIFGWRPFDFLAEWGTDRITEAAENYAEAIAGQTSANFANSQLALLTAEQAAAAASGVTIANDLNGAVAADLGAGWLRTSDGPGAGTWGTNGTGRAVWRKSGGLFRRHIDISTKALKSGTQIVTAVMSTQPQAPYLGSEAYNYLVARSDITASEFVWLRIGRSSVAIGKTVGDVWSAPWKTAAITGAPGNQWFLICGTTIATEYVVKQNGVVRLRHTDTSGAATTNLYAGFGASAGDRAVVIIPLLDQTIPGDVDTFSAADRLPEAV